MISKSKSCPQPRSSLSLELVRTPYSFSNWRACIFLNDHIHPPQLCRLWRPKQWITFEHTYSNLFTTDDASVVFVLRSTSNYSPLKIYYRCPFNMRHPNMHISILMSRPFDRFDFTKLHTNNSSTTPGWLCICCGCKYSDEILVAATKKNVYDSDIIASPLEWSFGELLGTLGMFFFFFPFIFIEWLIIIKLDRQRRRWWYNCLTSLTWDCSWEGRGLFTTCRMGAIGETPPKGHKTEDRDHYTSSTPIGGKGGAGGPSSSSHYAWGTHGVFECEMDVESTWIPTWHRMDRISWWL